VGYVIGRKSIRNAVDRNRLRRKLREALRAQPAAVARHDVVMRVTRARNRVEQDAATAEASRLLAELALRA
jgi:ribonuclease P protein component